mmetsp:Transcript_36341/g.81919  ORF Transcript_36341/g.81919 Transcript_36341/m.81919 type:complete len:277 (-) Transcript_36341:291-1121(-)
MVRPIVEHVRFGQQPLDHPGQPGAVPRFPQQLLGVDPLLPQPLCRQVDSAIPSILPHIPRDVRQLHGRPQVEGPSKCDSAASPHQDRHHSPDTRSDPGGVGDHVAVALVLHLVQVPPEPLQHRVQERLGDLEGSHDSRESSVDLVVVRVPVVRIGQSLLQQLEAQLCSLNVPLVHVIVGLPAEGVEGDGRSSHPARQQEAGEEEALRPHPHHVLTVDQVRVPVGVVLSQELQASGEVTRVVAVDHVPEETYGRETDGKVEGDVEEVGDDDDGVVVS